MTKRHLLHIDSSARIQGSVSRQLTQRFVSSWQRVYPSATVTYRDIGQSPVPSIDETWVNAYAIAGDNHCSNVINLWHSVFFEVLWWPPCSLVAMTTA